MVTVIIVKSESKFLSSTSTLRTPNIPASRIMSTVIKSAPPSSASARGNSFALRGGSTAVHNTSMPSKEKALEPLTQLLSDVLTRLEVLESKAGIVSSSTSTATGTGSGITPGSSSLLSASGVSSRNVALNREFENIRVMMMMNRLLLTDHVFVRHLSQPAVKNSPSKATTCI
jgi:hypothetical protein